MAKSSKVDLSKERTTILGSKRLANENAYIRAAAPAMRISLRAEGKDVAKASKALGLTLPSKPKTSVSRKDVHALWIGPDEWFIYADETTDLVKLCAKLPDTVSAVDISHRNTAIVISGPKARNIIAAACPHNTNDEAFPVGAATRTIFGKAEVILHRIDESTWRMECWRSFGEYVWQMASDSLKLNAS